MLIKKALSCGLFSERGFSFQKKLIVLFLFISLSVNGFAPSAAEVSKYSFAMVAVTVAKNVAMQIFKKCDASLTTIAGNFYFSNFNIFDSTPINEDKNKASESKGGTSSKGVEGIIIKQAVYKEKVKIIKDNKFFTLLLGGILQEKLMAGFVKIKSGEIAVIVIIFLLFIMGIRRRKAIDGENTINKIKIIERKAISV